MDLRLAGLAEVGELLGVSRRTATRYTNRKDFPTPVARLRSGPVWLEQDILAWAKTLPIARGRPPSTQPVRDVSDHR